MSSDIFRWVHELCQRMFRIFHWEWVSVIIYSIKTIRGNSALIQSWKKAQNVRMRTFWGFWNVLKSAWFSTKKKLRQKWVILGPSSILNPWSLILTPQSLILIIIRNASSILILNPHPQCWMMNTHPHPQFWIAYPQFLLQNRDKGAGS